MQRHLSWWERSVLFRPFDFIVLGAGLIGKQIALRLAEKHPAAHIALVDKYAIPYGASTRNAGFACFGSVGEILDDLSKSNKDEVLSLLHKRRTGIKLLAEDFGKEAIGFRQTGSFEIFRDKSEMELVCEHVNSVNGMIRDTGGPDAVFEIRSSDGLGMNVLEKMVFNPFEGMLNTGLLNEVVSDRVHRAGVIPLYGLEISDMQINGSGMNLYCTDGSELKANLLIVATNAYTGKLMPELDVEPARGQIIVTSEFDGLPFDGIFHEDKGYIYFRNLGNRILIGGARNLFRDREKTFDFSGSEELRSYLETYLREVIVPGKEFKTQMHWSGIMAMGSERIPLVRKLNEHMVICVRMGGMGVALGPVLSREVTELTG